MVICRNRNPILWVSWTPLFAASLLWCEAPNEVAFVTSAFPKCYGGRLQDHTGTSHLIQKRKKKQVKFFQIK